MVANIEKTDTNYAMGRYWISFEKTWDRSQIKLKKNRSERKSFKSTIQHENYPRPAGNNRYFLFSSQRIPTLFSVKHQPSNTGSM